MKTPATERFTSRVAAYRKYRPHYPKAVIQALRERTGFEPRHIVADVGSGTGISSMLFLDNGNFVYGIEPNNAMREAQEEYLSTYKNFRSVEGTAETTTLPDHSVDYIVAGQSFHWFDQKRAAIEFQRILRDHGWLVILWNDRETDTTPFLRDYEALLQEFGTDYNEINHRNIDSKKVRAFFQNGHADSVPILEMSFDNSQHLNYDGLEGRLLSSSYVPNARDPRSEPMRNNLRGIFNRHAVNGQIEMRYQTLLYAGQFSRA